MRVHPESKSKNKIGSKRDKTSLAKFGFPRSLPPPPGSRRHKLKPEAMTESELYQYLEHHQVSYERYQHPAVFTCEEAERWVPEIDAAKTKNLFVRDRKGQRHFLVVVGYDKQVDLNSLGQVLGCSRLSLGSAQRLEDRLGVQPGSVTILALANDRENQVELVLDEPISKARAVRCHPLVNTATLSLERQALDRFLESTGHQPVVVEVPSRGLDPGGN